ncbi:MAG TPA: hypothetical protein VG709_08125 [Actinomycetota bacterium]|nr:hypothetical protein [Actinomycetota bacterium]
MTAAGGEPAGERQDGLVPSLREVRGTQLARFGRYTRRFAALYERARRWDRPEFVTADWRARNRALERRLFPTPPARFLHADEIRYQMFVGDRCLAEQVAFLRILGHDASVLAEDAAGDPPMLVEVDGVVTSANTVHHVHHLRRFEIATSVACAAVGTVLEWGGGYGSLAKLFRRIHGGAPTYAIIDTPLFSCVQWLYLSSVFGDDHTHVLLDRRDTLLPGRFNLVPLALASSLEIEPQLFVSTWALNESAVDVQAMVVERRWFGAPHLLLGMHDGDPLIAKATRDGARAEPVGACMPAQRYLFR